MCKYNLWRHSIDGLLDDQQQWLLPIKVCVDTEFIFSGSTHQSAIIAAVRILCVNQF